MYERNAIIFEKYFKRIFGYDEKYNLKENYLKYSNLVDCSASYSTATDSEDKIMQEYDEVANRIKVIQKKQEILSKECSDYQQKRDVVFQNIAEDAEEIKKMFEELDKKIEDNNQKIKQNEKEYVEVISSFIEKSAVRNKLGKDRKEVEADYSQALSLALETYKNLNKEILESARNFNEKTDKIEKELYDSIKENGKNEKVQFDSNVIKNAIKLEINIQKKEIEILCSCHDKTTRLFSEIKNNKTKIERHQKFIKDSNAKLNFLNALKEYVIQFLDNERLTAVNGETEHKKMMKESCKNFEQDLAQINNMYELFLREIAGKANKKMYKELYNFEYLKELEREAKNFESEISKLNFVGTVIDPNHWRIDGMRKIYKVFSDEVTENYERNLSEFEDSAKEETEKEKIVDETVEENHVKEEKPEKSEDSIQNNINKLINFDLEDVKNNEDEEDEEDEFDERIDMILGFSNKSSNKNDEETQMPQKEDSKNELDFIQDDVDDDWDDDDFFEDSDDDFEDEDDDDDNDNFFDDDEQYYDSYKGESEGYAYEKENDEFDDNPWNDEEENITKVIYQDDDENEDEFKNTENKSKRIKGKHNKKEEKRRGLFGKLIK